MVFQPDFGPRFNQEKIKPLGCCQLTVPTLMIHLSYNFFDIQNPNQMVITELKIVNKNWQFWIFINSGYNIQPDIQLYNMLV